MGTQLRLVEQKTLAMVCAWCDRIVRPGPGPVTHGICSECRAEFERACETVTDAPTP